MKLIKKFSIKWVHVPYPKILIKINDEGFHSVGDRVSEHGVPGIDKIKNELELFLGEDK